jgi:hypothetical protein
MTGPITVPVRETVPTGPARLLGWSAGVVPLTAVYTRKTASSAATASAMTSLAGVRDERAIPLSSLAAVTVADPGLNV